VGGLGKRLELLEGWLPLAALPGPKLRETWFEVADIVPRSLARPAQHFGVDRNALGHRFGRILMSVMTPTISMLTSMT
jgi:hypothetical protein